jgi:hypothetical protein
MFFVYIIVRNVVAGDEPIGVPIPAPVAIDAAPILNGNTIVVMLVFFSVMLTIMYFEVLLTMFLSM